MSTLPKNTKMNSTDINDLSFTNAKSRLSVSTSKKPNKNVLKNKLMDIEEYDNERDPLNSGINKFTHELQKIANKGDKIKSKSKNLNNSINDDDQWLENSNSNTTEKDNNKYEKFLNAFSKMCLDRDLENQFMVDI